MISINNKTTKRILLPFFLLIGFLLQAQTDKQDMAKYVSNFYYQNFGEIKTVKNYYLLDSEQEIKEYAFNFKEGGYIIIRDEFPNYTVLGIIPKGNFSLNNNHFLGNSTDKAQFYDTEYPLNRDALPTATTASRITDDTVEPFLTDLWGGVNCFDDQDNMVYPTNYYTPYHCSPGCVAISNSQILHYYEWPSIGVGSNVYSENYNGSLYRHSAFFDETPYDWDHMLDNYYNIPSTDQEQRAVGKLLYDVGVSVEMDYEPSGSTNNLNNVPFVLENYFRFSGHYEEASWSPFWSRLYTSMQQQRPVPVAVEATETGDGHVFVANGYKVINGNPYYYINWGWWNVGPTYNGWYYLQGWNSGTAGYNTIIGAIFDMLPEPEITTITPTGTGDDFEIQWEVAQHLNWSEFTLEQKVDYGSWEEVASGITNQNYTITNPTGSVYQFRVKAKSEGSYYANSWSEVAIYSVSGSYNGFVQFEGSQYAYAKQTPDYDIRFTNDYTFETWINVGTNNQTADIILDQNNVFTLRLDEVTASDYSVLFKSYTNTSTSLNSNQSGSKLLTDHWHHIAVSKSGTTTRLFVDGEVRDSYTGSNLNLSLSNNPLNIGEMYHGSYSNRIVGKMDQMRISDIGRYTTNFAPDKETDFVMDANTISYFKFQDVHRKRFKDEAYNLSVRVSNSSGYVTWSFTGVNNSLSLEDQALLNSVLQVYPNPTSDYLNIQYSDNDRFNSTDFSLEIYDSTGKIIIHNEPDAFGNPSRINIENINPGTYFIIVKGKNFTASKKFIKQ